MSDRKPILTIRFVVETHTTTEDKEKADQYVVVMKTPDKSLKIGVDEAKAVLKIKALDDIVKYNFPLYGEFVCEIYVKTHSAEKKSSTKPTTLEVPA